jgi:hypothetical protein
VALQPRFVCSALAKVTPSCHFGVMVTVATCSNLAEAELLQSLLADSGIECFVPDELFGGNVRLLVADEHAAEAKRLLAEAEAKDEPSAADENKPA